MLTVTKRQGQILQSKTGFKSVVKMLRVPEVLLETREKFKGKQTSIFAREKAAVRKLILCINLNIPRKWLRPAEENIPTIWSENVVFPTRKGGEEPEQHWFYYFTPMNLFADPSAAQSPKLLRKTVSIYQQKWNWPSHV